MVNVTGYQVKALQNNCLLSFLSFVLSFALSDACCGVPTVVNVFPKGPVLNEDFDPQSAMLAINGSRKGS